MVIRARPAILKDVDAILTMDGDGLDPEAFAEACARLKPKALYLTPVLQNPTTITMPAQRREEIAGIARRHGVSDDAALSLLFALSAGGGTGSYA